MGCLGFWTDKTCQQMRGRGSYKGRFSHRNDESVVAENRVNEISMLPSHGHHRGGTGGPE